MSEIRKALLDMRDVAFRWVGIRQPDYSKRCACVREQPDGHFTTSNKCRRCLTTGYMFSDYLIKVYMWLGVLGVEFGASVGKISTQNRNMVALHERAINKFDIVLELDLDPETGALRQPFKIMRVFQVQDSMPLLAGDGKVEYWKCALEERNLDDYRAGQIGTGFDYQGNRSNVQP